MLIDLDRPAPAAPVRVWRYVEREWAGLGLLVAAATALAIVVAQSIAPAARTVVFRWSGGRGFAAVAGAGGRADLAGGVPIEVRPGGRAVLYVVGDSTAAVDCSISVGGVVVVTHREHGLGVVSICEAWIR